MSGMRGNKVAAQTNKTKDKEGEKRGGQGTRYLQQDTDWNEI